jgi:hypothetical protein
VSRPFVLLLAVLTLLGAACSDSKSPSTAAASSASSPPPTIAAGDFSRLCPALADFRDPFKDLPPVPTPKETQSALEALQDGYEVLARLAPPPVDEDIRASLVALRAYDQFLAARSYDLNGLEGDARTQHDQLEADYEKAAGVVETAVKAACPQTTSTTSS